MFSQKYVIFAYIIWPVIGVSGINIVFIPDSFSFVGLTI